ncbi:CLUMA_CG002891, isoform A [Clunio marinus]|uniref:CLUMA_CG002891, isoform A n=1 Tax=Clunio marinus TaxID=568069 RepID=A0A1J1HNL9_9DIPT|nr:CLUMA_CG002891, isoform A [Clunio marinus]
MNNNYPAIQARVSGRFEARQIMRKQHLRRTFSCESIARGQHQEKHKTKERKHSIREQWNDTWMAIDLGRRRNDLNSKSQRMGLKMEEIDDRFHVVHCSFVVAIGTQQSNINYVKIIKDFVASSSIDESCMKWIDDFNCRLNALIHLTLKWRDSELEYPVTNQIFRFNWICYN